MVSIFSKFVPLACKDKLGTTQEKKKSSLHWYACLGSLKYTMASRLKQTHKQQEILLLSTGVCDDCQHAARGKRHAAQMHASQ